LAVKVHDKPKMWGKTEKYSSTGLEARAAATKAELQNVEAKPLI